MHTLVINEPHCLYCGLPRERCTCGKETTMNDREDYLPLPKMEYDPPREDTRDALREENLRRLGVEPQTPKEDYLPLPRMQY